MSLLLGLGLCALVLALGAGLHNHAYVARIRAAHPPVGRQLRVNGAEVHVIAAGETGPPVLMIHGASANAREFAWTLAPRLEDGHRVFMADRPGHGHSGRLSRADRLGVQAAQMAGALDQLAPGEKAVVVGHSFGGAVALRLALDRPDLVKGLVLIAPVSHDWGTGGGAWYNAWAGAPVVGRAFSQLVPLVGPAAIKAGVRSVFDPAPAPEGYFEKSGVGLLFRPENFRANARDVNALQKELAEQSKRYDALALPIIVFSGALDTVLKPQLHVGKLKHQAKNLTLVPLAEEGHMPHHGHAEAVADAIARLASGGDAP